jgi:hypothetical protein
MQFSIQQSGGERVVLGLEQTVARAARLSDPTLRDPLRKLYTGENRENLLGEGSMVGGWLALTPGTIRDKERKGFGGKRIEERTGKLFRSLTEPGADGFREEFSDDQLLFIHDLPYVAAQDETRRLRPEPDAGKYATIFVEYAARVGREEGFEVIV